MDLELMNPLKMEMEMVLEVELEPEPEPECLDTGMYYLEGSYTKQAVQGNQNDEP
jgi:hypothetical protein